jgi:hypothetical protein
MIKIQSLQCAATATFTKESPESEPQIQEVKQTAAQVEGQWYGDGAMGIPFTEELTQTEHNLLNELLTTVAARVAKKKQEENARAPRV